MRVIAARSKFFYQSKKKATHGPKRAYSHSSIRIGLAFRMWVCGLLPFVTLFYGNGETKFPDKAPAEHCLVFLVRDCVSSR
jgi:hypothetical protein